MKWWSSCCFLALAKPQLPRGPLPNLSLKNIISLYFYHPKPPAKQILSVHKACTKQTRTNFPPLQLTSLKWLGYSCKVTVAHQSLEVSYRAALATFPTANLFFVSPRKIFHFKCEHTSLGSKGARLPVRVEVELTLLCAHVLEAQQHKVRGVPLVSWSQMSCLCPLPASATPLAHLWEGQAEEQKSL